MKIFLLAFLPWLCFAQDSAAPQGFFGNAEGSYLSTSGNTSNQTLGLGTELNYIPSAFTHRLRGNGNRVVTRQTVDGVKQQVTTNREYYAEYRLGRDFSPRLSTFFQADWFQNRLAGINERKSASLGPSYKVIDQETHQLKTEGSGGVTNEERILVDTVTGEPSIIEQDFVAGKIAVIYEWKINATTVLSDEVVYTHNFENSDDWRFANTLGFTNVLSSLLSLKLSHRTTRLNLPAEGKTPTDTATAISIIAKF